jgi:CubicO group peptidase (beta-lactamase class C family)
MQSILNLKTPAGAAPPDPNFGKVTIQNLLEHTSGINAGGDGGGMAVINAYAAAGITKSLPVTQDMVDAYIASLPLVSVPVRLRTTTTPATICSGACAPSCWAPLQR